MTTSYPQKTRGGRLAPLFRQLGYVDYQSLPSGISFAGERHATSDIRFLADVTFIDPDGRRAVEQEIFDEMLTMIARAQKLIVLDMFLINDLLLEPNEEARPLSGQITDALIARKRTHPGMQIFFITDPCNTVYGAIPSRYFAQLEEANIPVLLTNLDQLRDSNPIYTFLWRAFVRPFGNSPGGLMPNPFGGARRISLRSYLQIANIKANHRKTLIADDGDDWVGFVTTANPHDASHAHRNVAVRFTGPAVSDLLHTELAVLEMSGVEAPSLQIEPPAQSGDTTLQIVTEGKIKEAVLEAIQATRKGDGIDLILFYLADREVLRALNRAHRRGAQVRMILDPNKDAFGWSKSGIPNRPVAYRLNRNGIPVRWADTHGEQCHSKLMLINYASGSSILIQGSANFTRRNMDDFNLETDVRIEGPREAEVFESANGLFDELWNNRHDRRYTIDYAFYAEKSMLQHWIYWLMEKTGISTF